jgi:hypothetical protein
MDRIDYPDGNCPKSAHAPPQKKTKAPPIPAAHLVPFRFARSDFADVYSLGAFGALGDLELHAIALGQRLETVRVDVAIMDKRVRTVLTRNETKTLRVVEPLHFAGSHCIGSF